MIETNGGSRMAPEVLDAEFMRFIAAMDIDIDPKGLDDDDKKSLEACKRVVIRALESGKLVVNEAGEPVFTPASGAPITFAEPTGAVFMARDKKKEGHDVAKMFATMAELTHQQPGVFATMPGREVKVCLAITQLFLA